ncbi:MAG: YlxM family DNA-binding protein [Bilifractor sp.]
MEEFVEKSYLYDFYGELLTEHQRRIYTEINFDDYSPAEVARDEGISRQGVHDLMKRCDRILEDYEKRLHLVEKFLKIRDNVREIQKLTASGRPEDTIDADEMQQRMEQIREISSSILQEL